MKILDAKFITSAVNRAGIPNKENLPEIAFVGRSNVGKSSLINCMLNRKNLAYTSSTPGKTRQLNYFLINNAFYVVDLPGYGFAKTSKTEQATWKKFIESYFEDISNLKLLVLLIDIRHELKDSDQIMMDYLNHFKVNYIITLTKADKLNSSQLKKQLDYFSKVIPDVKILQTSSESKIGRDKLLKEITNYI